MRANMFFRVLAEGRKLYQREKNLMLMDLCSVATVALGAKNFENAIEHFGSRMIDRRPKALRVDDRRTFDIVSAAFNAAAPFMSGAPGRG